MKNINSLVVGIILLLVSASCNTIKITSSWKASELPAKQYKKILVLGLIHEKNRLIQEQMENHLVGDLSAMGYNAISALQEYGPAAFADLDEKAALQKLKNSGVDAVITIVLLDKKRERRYVASNMYFAPYGIYNNFWDYRSALYYRIYQPGYFVTDTKYFWESNFYDMSNQALLYSVQTKSFSPSDTEGMEHEYGKMIVKTMTKENILHSTN